MWPMLVAESLKALGGLGILSLGGKLVIRRIFEVCCFLFFPDRSLYFFDSQLLIYYTMAAG
jgi:hypothetical protein